MSTAFNKAKPFWLFSEGWIPYIAKDQSSHLVYIYQHMHDNKRNLSSMGRWSCEIIMKEKTPLPDYSMAGRSFGFQMLDIETSKSRSEVSKPNSLKITSFSKASPLQREPFLTMFYTIDLSPLLLTKWGLTIISSYQSCNCKPFLSKVSLYLFFSLRRRLYYFV